MVSSIERFIAESPFIAIFIVFWAGLLESFGIYTLVRIPIAFGLLAGLSRSKRNLLVSLLFLISGFIICHVIFGIYLGTISALTSSIIVFYKYISIILGGILLLTGIYTLLLLDSRFQHFDLLTRGKLKIVIYCIIFIIGASMALIDMPICSDHPSTFLVIVKSALAKGSYLYCILMLVSFAIGQSVPVSLISGSTAIAKYFTPKVARFSDYVRLLAGNILIAIGIYFIIVA